jgi:hypothetical protein
MDHIRGDHTCFVVKEGRLYMANGNIRATDHFRDSCDSVLGATALQEIKAVD